jgi:Type II secretion system (T2SS), protein E, N-terminal domain
MPLLDGLRRLSRGMRSKRPKSKAKTYPVRGGRGCENPSCTAPRKPLSAPPRRCFEGKWMCSDACWSAVLRQRLDRELDAFEPGEIVTHAHRVPLGLVLLSIGVITEAQLQSALEQQRQAKQGRIGDWLRKDTDLGEKEITRALGMQWNCPVFDLAAYRPQRGEIPRELVEIYRFLPLPARNRGLLYLAFDRALNPVASYAVQHMTGLRVEAGLAGEDAFAEKWSRSLAMQTPAAAVVKPRTREELLVAAASVLQDPAVTDASLARLHQHIWLRVFLASEEEEDDASDVPGYRDYLLVVPESSSR